MNVIKIKDILMPSSYEKSEFFNSKLKGRYAYWVKMRYIFPLEDITYNEYISYEQADNDSFNEIVTDMYIDIYSENCCMMDFVNVFVDSCETEKINTVNELLAANKYVSDEELDVRMLKRFRTWLAEEILEFNKGTFHNDLGKFTSNQLHMLEYYKGNMYNDVVKQLTVFGNDYSIATNTTTGGCPCSSSIISTEFNTSCDCINTYKRNIHKLMVITFEDIEFWTRFNREFIKIVKSYVDNILKLGFVINNSKSLVKSTCNCNTHDNSNNEILLKNFSIALDYIYNDDVFGHKNFISDALHNWAEYLYDYMYWN